MDRLYSWPRRSIMVRLLAQMPHQTDPHNHLHLHTEYYPLTLTFCSLNLNHLKKYNQMFTLNNLRHQYQCGPHPQKIWPPPYNTFFPC